MTTKPKAKKFRIRRGPPSRGADPAAANQGETTADGATSATNANIASAHETGVDSQIDEIRREGLTGRQLRLARRMAQKHELPATSDFDAVRLLREKGIDPFQRSNMLELVVPTAEEPKEEAKPEEAKQETVQLPQTIEPKKQTLPSTDTSPAAQRIKEIGEIQRDIIRRRRRKTFLLAARLAIFILLPTAMVGYYFNVIATPMYESKSEFLILKADGGGGSAGGGLLAMTPMATSQDSIAVQSYLMSKDAMLRLDRDVGFKEIYTQEEIDPIQRLSENPSNEQAYKTYKKNIKVSYDPTEGVIRMRVIAPDPDIAADYSRILISYAEERVNHLSEKKRADQMQESEAFVEDAHNERRKAQEALIELQMQGAVLDPENVLAGLRKKIDTVELEIQEKQLAVNALEDNPRPNKAKVDGLKADIGRLEDLLDDLNAQMLDASKGENSLARLNLNIQMAQADLGTRDSMLQMSLQQLDETRKEANRQVRYLTTAVSPVASQDPSYPRKFENTVVALLIFAGLYLILSLTASILREQITS